MVGLPVEMVIPSRVGGWFPLPYRWWLDDDRCGQGPGLSCQDCASAQKRGWCGFQGIGWGCWGCEEGMLGSQHGGAG